MSQSKILYLFTRTPLHVGAGSSVGAIDQPVVRERHTGFPIVPASSLKGTFADAWNDGLLEQDGKPHLRLSAVKNEKDKFVPQEVSDAAWLFGSNNDKVAFSGALQFSECKLLAFPIRSAKGSFAWITCPLMLARAARDHVPGILPLAGEVAGLFEGGKGDAVALFSGSGPLALKVNADTDQVVLEEYTFSHAGELPDGLGKAMEGLMTDEAVWNGVASRLVILSDGMLSYFAQNACDVAQHVRISDETGTAEKGALFNQENVPSETLFYSVIRGFRERTPQGQARDPEKALDAISDKIKDQSVFQFGGDASTGLGYCSVHLG